MSVELKPCPFCGSKWTQVRWMGFDDNSSAFCIGYRAECTDCGAITKAFTREKDAAEAWNRRANK